jgi:hypothetical protein
MAVHLRATSDLMVAVYLTKYSDLETRIWRRKNSPPLPQKSNVSPRNIQKHVENPSYNNFEEYNCNYIIILLDSSSVYLRTIYRSEYIKMIKAF